MIHGFESQLSFHDIFSLRLEALFFDDCFLSYHFVLFENFFRGADHITDFVTPTFNICSTRMSATHCPAGGFIAIYEISTRSASADNPTFESYQHHAVSSRIYIPSSPIKTPHVPLTVPILYSIKISITQPRNTTHTVANHKQNHTSYYIHNYNTVNTTTW